MTGREVRIATTASQREDAFDVRREVFVEGQGVPEERELDGRDDEAVHFVAYEGATAVGAARLRELAPDAGKVERVSVRGPHRGEGWGRRLVAAVESEARERDLSVLVLHAQTDVEAFYRRLGYRTVSAEFEEAGMPHVEMEKRLP